MQDLSRRLSDGRSVSPWEFQIIPRYTAANGTVRSGIVWLAHHVVGDGVSLTEFLMMTTTKTTEENATKAHSAAPHRSHDVPWYKKAALSFLVPTVGLVQAALASASAQF